MAVAGVAWDRSGQPYLKKHLVREPRCISFDAGLLEEAVGLGAERIEVYARDTHRTFRCTMGYFRGHSFSQDRGHGLQRFLPLVHWEVDGQPSELAQRQAEEDARRKREAETPQQLSLLGGDE
jgi:hypothetical protein